MAYAQSWEKLDTIASNFLKIGNYNDAVKNFCLAYEKIQKELGEENDKGSYVLKKLAYALLKNGNYEEAKSECKKLLEIFNKSKNQNSDYAYVTYILAEKLFRIEKDFQ
jgi:tetratricopeptide (TPR) repeat protein